MATDRVTDGRRIAQLLASELDGRADGGLDRVAVTDADPDAEPSVDGTRAYDVTAEGGTIATVYVHPERARVEFVAGREAAAEAAREAGLRVRPVGARPPRTLVFVEDGAAVKGAARVAAAAAGATSE